MKKNLVLLFTQGISLKIWEKSGLIDREISLYNQLMDFGFEITFITYGDKDDLKYQKKLKGINIEPIFKSSGIPKSKFILFFSSLLIPIRYQTIFKQANIIKSNQILGSLPAVIAAKFYRKKLIIRGGYDLYKFSINLNKSIIIRIFTYLYSLIAYKSADVIHISSEPLKDFINNKFNIDDKKIRVVPNFIDTDKFKNHCIDRSNDILFIGRLTKQKNLPFLMNVVSKTHFGITVVGNGPEEEFLQDMAFKLGIKARFINHISNDEIIKLYNTHKVFVSCSRFEGNPKVILEAMSSETPIVCLKCQGINEIIGDNHNGIIIDQSEKKLAHELHNIISKNNYSPKLLKNAREYILENNSLEKIVEKEIYSYDKVIGLG
jgi:glycosyltransferase involved in cell wall biosynthesis